MATGAAKKWASLGKNLGRVARGQLPRLRGQGPTLSRPTLASPSPAVPPAVSPNPTPHSPPTITASAPTQRRARRIDYAPDLDGSADPGEVVWSWVQFEEDPSQGKDRPVLVVGREGPHLLGLMLSSQARHDGEPGWYALGPGPWDSAGRPSWLRLDRVLDVPENGIRREGAVLGKPRFDRVAAQLKADYGWA